MLEKVRTFLDEVGAHYHDTRLQYFQVEATQVDGDQIRLSGAVLDREAYSYMADQLLARFPDYCFDAGNVQILCSPTPEVVAVTTNLTGLYAAPTFLAEQVSQLVNGAPLEVLMTRERWAFVRQADGYLGWAYLPYLAGPAAIEPTHIISAPICELREAANDEAPLVTLVPGGTLVSASMIQDDWARLTLAGDLAGWVKGADVRSLGALPIDEAGRRRQMVADAMRYIGVPYSWGGCTALGIDCSGFVQLIHRLSGMTLPRDADMQYEAGRPAEPPFLPGDLLFFSETGENGRITHVTMSLGGSQIIHASRAHNGVYVDDLQRVPHLQRELVGGKTFAGEQ